MGNCLSQFLGFFTFRKGLRCVEVGFSSDLLMEGLSLDAGQLGYCRKVHTGLE